MSACALALLLAGAARPAGAHIAREAPWEPLAAAYLFGVFATAIQPIDWQGITDRFAGDRFPGQNRRSVFAGLEPVSRFSDLDHEAAIRHAIVNRDRAAFLFAAGRAESHATRFHLERAAAEIAAGRPGAAKREIDTAHGLFRAFERFIREADGDGFRRLGTAWLDMRTAAGMAGIGGSGALPPDRKRFTAAMELVTGYLVAHYERPRPADAPHAAPVPLAGKGRDATWRPAPWLPPDAHVLEQQPLPRLVLSFEAHGIDEKDLFLVAYGDMLFDSPEIFGEPAKSLGITCSSCHNRSEANRQFFIPGLSVQAGGVDVDSGYFNPRANDMRLDPVDIPSLRGIRFTAPYGRDGRTASLREFVRNVVVVEFAGPEPTPLMLDALVAYLNEFDFLPNPMVERDGRLSDRASAAARRGEALFGKPFPGMGGRSCASCHLPASHFLDGRRHDIGSRPSPTVGALDGALDTPTLLGVAYTAPYFHDGALATLADVVDWFETRFTLGLTAREKADLVAYLEAVGGGEAPYERFDARNTRFRLGFTELSTFAGTLGTLIPARDKVHALLLIRTVAADMRLDASGIYDVRQAPKVYELADRLESLGRAIEADDWAGADRLWAAYKAAEKRHDGTLY